MKKILTAAAVLLLLFLARFAVFEKAEETLRREGWTWESSSPGLLQITWNTLKRNDNRIESAHLSLLPSPHLALKGAEIHYSSQTTGGGEGPPRVPVGISIESGSILFPDGPAIKDLNGTISPVLDLQNESMRIAKESGLLMVSGSKRIERPNFSADLDFEARQETDGLAFTIAADELVLEHGKLGVKELSLPAGKIEGRWTDGEVEAELRIGEASFALSGSFQPGSDAAAYRLSLESESLALTELMGWWRLPELERVEVLGSLGLIIECEGDPLKWSAEFSADGWATKGRLFDILSFKRGALPHKPLNGEDFRLIGPGSEEWTPLARMGWVPAAAVAAEDSSFYSHPGYDIEGLQIALDELAQGKEAPRGGSTITQQLAKNLFLDGQRNLKRKLRELLYALELERQLEKDEILELYLNVVEFGPGIYGIGNAAHTYFLKPPAALTPREAAYLASVLPSPTYFFKKVQKQDTIPGWKVNGILENMWRGDKLDEGEYRRALDALLIVVPPRP
jgi:hypothetical protein